MVAARRLFKQFPGQNAVQDNSPIPREGANMLATVLWGRATGLAITAALTAVLGAVTAQGRPPGGAAKMGARRAGMSAAILRSGTLRADRSVQLEIL